MRVFIKKLTSNKWFEEIQVIFEDEIHTLKFPPALLKMSLLR